MHSELAGDWLFLGESVRRHGAHGERKRMRAHQKSDAGWRDGERGRERVARTDFSGIQLLRTLDSRNRSDRGEK